MTGSEQGKGLYQFRYLIGLLGQDVSGGNGDRRHRGGAEPRHEQYRSCRSGTGPVEFRPFTRGQDRERGQDDGQDQDRRYGVEHLRGVVEDDDRASVPAPVGQGDGHDAGQVDGDHLAEADERQAARPACHPGREPQDGPEPQVQPPRRRHGHEDQGGDAQRGAHRQDKLGFQGNPGQRKPLVQGHEGEVAGNEHQAGDPWADGRPGEPAVGLQQSVENDREPVQQGLGGEHRQHAAGGSDHIGPDAVRVRVGGVEQRGDRTGGRHDGQDQRHQDDNGPGQQR